ncbi:mCG1046394, partial [Mus musculus]
PSPSAQQGRLPSLDSARMHRCWHRTTPTTGSCRQPEKPVQEISPTQ